MGRKKSQLRFLSPIPLLIPLKLLKNKNTIHESNRGIISREEYINNNFSRSIRSYDESNDFSYIYYKLL